MIRPLARLVSGRNEKQMVTCMPLAHPTYDMLSAYAAGTAPEGVALLVAAHLTYCPLCRDEVARIEAISAALYDAAGEAEMTAGALERALAQLDDGIELPRRAARDGLLPAPVAAVTGPFEALRWRFLMPGVSKVDIAVEGDETVSLLRVRPGAGVPQHTHTAEEATLVLCGALRDRGRVYARGDVAVATDEDDHHPRAEPGADCICLAVLSGSVRFTGRLGRALNLFAE
jgi:putative transcriptional regulator